MKTMIYILFFAVCCVACNHKERVRSHELFNCHWQFVLSDSLCCYHQLDQTILPWKTIDLPHDWSIEAPFSSLHPATPGGGALPGGVGWYRKTFTLDRSDSNKTILICFDGIYQCSTVWINGHELGRRPNGYISFVYDLTPYLYFDNRANQLVVKADNSQQPNSRWYSGSGIYRNVWLTKTHRTRVDTWGTAVVTPEITSQKALVELTTTLVGCSLGQNIQLRTTLISPSGMEVARMESTVDPTETGRSICSQRFELENPQRWTLDSPHMYRALTQVVLNQTVVDDYETPFGVRSLAWSADSGFFLNDEAVKIKGVCLHHDFGCLGAAFNLDAARRQLQRMKEMGANAIRTAHNPPAPQLLDLCDQMGLLVMNETFDMWRAKKTTFDYACFFDQWHERDLTDQLLRDRNHPSVFMWSIGNEVLEQWNDSALEGQTGADICKRLARIIRCYDSTRAITAGCNDVRTTNPIFTPGGLDVIGFNYHHDSFTQIPDSFPHRPFIVTESTSALMSRGEYDFPADSVFIRPQRWDIPFDLPEHTCSSFDNCHVPWGSTHEESWHLVKTEPPTAGLFVWTGFDYLGEPTPYGWPSRSSFFGICDLAGFPKDVYYMYQSEWTDKQVLHLLPHWNWREGQLVDVWAYYNNADEVELFLNGKSLGIRTKNESAGVYHASWRVPFSAGRLKVVSSLNGKTVLTRETVTAGAPAAIRLTAEECTPGSNLRFIVAQVVDKSGVNVPQAQIPLQFSASSGIRIVASDNGNPNDSTSLSLPRRTTYNGKALVVVEVDTSVSLKQRTIWATASGLSAAELVLN